MPKERAGTGPRARRIRPFRAIVLFASAWIAGCGGTPAPVPAPERPNVVLVSIDTLRADRVSVYGYERETAPRLAQMAKDGIVFERAYAHVPFTLPSHISMMTSLLPAAHGVTPEVALSPEVPTLAELLQEAGYDTWGFYAQDWVAPHFGFGRGFDVYEFQPDAPAALERVREVLAERDDPRRPFFLFFHMQEVHCKLHQGHDLYPSPPEFRNAFLPHPDVEIRATPQEIWDHEADLSAEELANLKALYDGAILYADSLVGSLEDELRGRGLWRDSLVVVTSDHGESLGDRDDFNAHGLFWEEGLRVPLVLKLPDGHDRREDLAGSRVARPVQVVDIPPTVLQTVDLPVPEVFQGVDLLDEDPRGIVAWRNNMSVLVEGSLKLKRTDLGREVRLDLYDLEADPGELSPLADDEDTVEAMRRRLEGQLRADRQFFESTAVADQAPRDLSDAERKRLEALGYLGD